MEYLFSSAVIDGDYRYELRRAWSEELGVTWIMLNPSTADADVDDPTIRKCVGFAKSWGFGAIRVVNLFALRVSDPKKLDWHSSPMGQHNDVYLYRALVDPEYPVKMAAWGASGDSASRYFQASKVKTMAFETGRVLACLGRTKLGHPRHPLYVPYDTELEEYFAAVQ